MPVNIYLRAIKRGNKDYLAMFDSNRNGAINKLTTVAKPGNTIYWKLDRQSGIERITRIYSKQAKRIIFEIEPRSLRHVFILRIPRGINKGWKKAHKEKYFIECILKNKEPLKIDPYIKIPPPPGR
jgi:hypothetical protein